MGRFFQWSVCADNNQPKYLCIQCDVALNELVLRWAGDKNWRKKLNRYILNKHKR